MNTENTRTVLEDIFDERVKQEKKWGEQEHPVIAAHISPELRLQMANSARSLCDKAAVDGDLTWEHIVTEEIFEAWAEKEDSPELRNELVQSAAVIVAAIENMDRRYFLRVATSGPL